MGIRVNPSKAVTAAVSYLEPEFHASWVAVQVLAEVTLPDVYQVDVVTPTDLKTLAFTKVTSDESILSDDKILDVLKAVADAVTIIDLEDVTVQIEKLLTENQNLADALTKGITKPITGDSLNPNDDGEADVALTFTKALAETTDGFAEVTTLLTNKGVADSFSMVDSADITYEIVKILADAPVVTETLAQAIDKLMAGEQLYLTDNMDGGIEYEIVKVIGDLQLILDQSNIVVDKGLSESVEATDAISTLLIFVRSFSETATADDAITKALEKPLTETLTEPDTVALEVNRPLPGETATAADLISNTLEKLVKGLEQDYVDPSYFLTQDYVNDVVDGDYVYLALDEFTRQITYGRSVSDNILPSESGSVISQGYVQPDYLLEDYVGSATTF